MIISQFERKSLKLEPVGEVKTTDTRALWLLSPGLTFPVDAAISFDFGFLPLNVSLSSPHMNSLSAD